MSHAIYTTEAIVLDQHNFGEANRWYFLLTPDYGLVMARAQGAREAKSKLRGHLSLLSPIQVSLVLGREYWHLVGAEKAGGENLIKLGTKKYQTLARVAGLLRRLLPEAAPAPELFALVKSGFQKIVESVDHTTQLYAREVVLVWQILRELGHIDYPNPEVAKLEAGEISEPELTRLTGEINRALSHSQL